MRVLLIVAALLFSNVVHAASLPDPAEQEALIKTTLLALNHANVTGDYTAFRASLSKVARDRVGPEQLADIFKEFRVKHINIDAIAREKPIPTQAAEIDDDGVLTLKGYFKTREMKVLYELLFDQGEGPWKPGAVQVDTKDWKD